jgi:hypothetical protein
MSVAWSGQELALLERADELEIATVRDDGTLRRWVPIWVVTAGGQAYVRTWQRRDTGWFGRVLQTPRAWIRVPGLECGVDVVDVGAGRAEVRAAVDAAYRAKYGRYGTDSTDRMVADAAAAATLRLDRSDRSR